MELSEKKQRMLVFLCWLVYTAAYCGRYGYNANINFVISDFGVTHAEAGLVATLFFFASTAFYAAITISATCSAGRYSFLRE